MSITKTLQKKEKKGRKAFGWCVCLGELGLSVADTIHSSYQTAYVILNRLESHDTTRPVLDVLAQGTKSFELRATAGVELRTTISHPLMSRASKVLIQSWETSELFMAKVAFEVIPVPSSLGRLECLGCASDHSTGVGNQVARIVLSDEAVDGLACGAGTARPGFEVQDECRCRHELAIAVSAQA
jgi:hypothetical protein